MSDQSELGRETVDPQQTKAALSASAAPMTVQDPVQYHVPPDETVTTALVWLVESVADADLDDEPTRLGDVLDADALNALFPPEGKSDLRVEFEQWGYRVSITGDRLITLTARE